MVNAFGAKLMGRSETFIVAIKVAILVLFAAVGLWFIKPGNLSPELWPATKSMLFGAGVLFIGYEGFGLVTNAAGDMRNPRRMLPRALYTSVILVIIDLSRGLADGERQPVGRADRAAPGTMRWPRRPSRSWASSASG